MTRPMSLRFLLRRSSLARRSWIWFLTFSSIPNILVIRSELMASVILVTRASEASVNFFCVPCCRTASVAGSGVVRTSRGGDDKESTRSTTLYA